MSKRNLFLLFSGRWGIKPTSIKPESLTEYLKYESLKNQFPGFLFYLYFTARYKEEDTMADPNPDKTRKLKWLKGMGIGAFLFFSNQRIGLAGRNFRII